MKQHRVCPWWLGYLLASPLRGLFENPNEVVMPYVREGMTVPEPGPGMGFFTLPLARLVGPGGRVVAVEVQPWMLAGLKKSDWRKPAFSNEWRPAWFRPDRCNFRTLRARWTA